MFPKCQLHCVTDLPNQPHSIFLPTFCQSITPFSLWLRKSTRADHFFSFFLLLRDLATWSPLNSESSFYTINTRWYHGHRQKYTLWPARLKRPIYSSIYLSIHPLDASCASTKWPAERCTQGEANSLLHTTDWIWSSPLAECSCSSSHILHASLLLICSHWA